MDWMGKLLKLPNEFLSPFCGGKLGGGMIQVRLQQKNKIKIIII